MTILGAKKRQISQHYTILWAKKINKMPLFFWLFTKNHYSHAHGLSKKRQLFKKHTVLMLIIWQKNVNYLKDKMLSSHVFWFNFPKIMEKTVVLEV